MEDEIVKLRKLLDDIINELDGSGKHSMCEWVIYQLHQIESSVPIKPS